MFAGLGRMTSQAPLTEKEEEYLAKFFAYGLNLTPLDYQALPEDEQMAMEELNQTWRLQMLYLTRTATQ